MNFSIYIISMLLAFLLGFVLGMFFSGGPKVKFAPIPKRVPAKGFLSDEMKSFLSYDGTLK